MWYWRVVEPRAPRLEVVVDVQLPRVGRVVVGLVIILNQLVRKGLEAGGELERRRGERSGFALGALRHQWGEHAAEERAEEEEACSDRHSANVNLLLHKSCKGYTALIICVTR